MKKQLSIIQFGNIGALYDPKGMLVKSYEGHKPTGEVEAFLRSEYPSETVVVHLFRRLVVSSPEWPFSNKLKEALFDINKIQKEIGSGKGGPSETENH